MWSSKKLKNRRNERRHILDVKLRSKERRQGRVRKFALTLTVSLSVFTGLFLLWRGGEWMLRYFLFENTAFSIHQIDIQTDGAIASDQLRKWAGVKYDDNLLALDLARVKRDLELVPLIEAAAVERVLPHTLRIRVTERDAVAQFLYMQARPGGQYEKGAYLIDSDGFVMWPLESQQRSTPTPTNEHLPVFVGVQPNEVRPGRCMESPHVKAALHLLGAFDKSPMAGLVDIKEVDLTLPNLLQVATSQGSEVVLGLADLEGQLRHWRAVYDHGQKTGKAVAWIDLSVANNIPARWLEASLTPQVPVKPMKTPRTRKKNA
ncbi:MAG TPA: FtsQ-type POTRA domain-containing protein [Verrucomicrobiae bacterium]|nr:FtsQ-type POTRA domain-containing protein [Verrucomicrobiae bacterium]